MEQSLYATPRHVADPKACVFYHTTDLPGHGHFEGIWDLRAGIHKYLGGVPLRGRRVLEVGTASGFVCFHMERQGAEVVAFDLTRGYAWDVVPYARSDLVGEHEERLEQIDGINNAWWLCHRVHRSRARVVYGSTYDIPEAIGPVDLAVFGCILLHLRDPFLALQNAARLTRETIVVTERLVLGRAPYYLVNMLGFPSACFVPHPVRDRDGETWWTLSPTIVRRMLAVLGFEKTRTRFHVQRCLGRRRLMYTVVGTRTRTPPGSRILLPAGPGA